MRICSLAVCSAIIFMSTEMFPTHALPTASTKTYDVDTAWTDVKMEIVAVYRLDSQNVLMVIQVDAGTKADRPTFIGFMDKPDLKKQSGDQKKAFHPKYRPFSLDGSFVVDQANSTQYGTVPQTPGKPSYGPSILITTMSPGDWFQLSVQFRLPAPPSNPDGTVPIQKVAVTLPQAKSVIKSLIVPPKQSGEKGNGSSGVK